MMSDLLDQINALIDASNDDVDRIEHTLTDGYAQAMSLEAERWRLERRISEGAAEIAQGDMAANARVLSALTTQLEANAGELRKLRSRLAELRRLAESARVAAG
jgi:predicted  nucleic acid-binding Zn-ribbon protein